MSWDSYKIWSKSQPCIDCGKLKNGTDIWVTEIQCFDCFKKYGNTEKRGLTSSKDLALKNNAMP